MEKKSGSSDASKPTGSKKVRESARADSLNRIVSAARHLFVSVGYDGATLRMIADRADMALGTLFYYARDKRDLIYLIFNDEFDAATTQGVETCRDAPGFKAKVLAITEPFYRFFAREPELSLILLSEVQQHSPGLHLAQNLAIRERFISALEGLVKEAQNTGEIQYAEESRIITLNIFFCFSSAVRWWIASPAPKWRAGHKEFERLLDVIMHGLMHSNRPKEVRHTLNGKRKRLSPEILA